MIRCQARMKAAFEQGSIIFFQWCNLTCSGVPVIRSRCSTSTVRTALLREEFSFLILCASSMMRYLHLIFASLLRSFNIPSYEVTRTSHLYFPVVGSTGKYSFSKWRRSSFVPPIRIARMHGHHFLNSLIQLPSEQFKICDWKKINETFTILQSTFFKTLSARFDSSLQAMYQLTYYRLGNNHDMLSLDTASFP